jgi:hypothetical protein
MNDQKQEIHLWPAIRSHGITADELPVLRLPNGPAVVTLAPLSCASGHEGVQRVAPGAVLVEPLVNQSKQLRLLARFPEEGPAVVNGEPAPSLVVLAPGDFFQCDSRPGFHIVLFSKPQIGPPAAAVLGKPCAVCRVPFAVDSICLVCLCGAVLHCEPETEDGLACARMRPDCPVCRRPLILTEGYVNPPSDEA